MCENPKGPGYAVGEGTGRGKRRRPLYCKVCGDFLPKYALDRYTDDLCGRYCHGRWQGAEALAAMILMGEAIRVRLIEQAKGAHDFSPGCICDYSFNGVLDWAYDECPKLKEEAGLAGGRRQ